MIDITALNQERLQGLFPPLIEKVRAMIAECNQQLDPMLITQGLRTWDQQHALFMQGRVGLSIVNGLRRAAGWAPITPIENTRTVTNAEAGTSFHNYGLAIDVVPITSVGTADWNETHPDWQTIIQIAAAHGLEHGDRGFHDNPHFQLIGKGTTPSLMRSLFKPNDLSACWAEVQKRLT